MEKPKVISANKINYFYPDGTHALKDITFNIHQGEKIAIIGPNGAGKSSLMFYLACLIGASENLEIAGMKYSKKTEREIRKKIGFVFQDPDDQIFCLKVFDEIAFAPLNLGLSKDEVVKQVNAALKVVEIEGYSNRMCSHLSYGEKKRVCIAAVISSSPEILFLDEPTANLDLKRRRDLINFINSFDKTMLIATHDLDLALEVTQRTILLNGGCLIADKPTQDILHNEELLKANDLELPLSIAGKI